MFKILTLNSGVDDQLQAIQDQWEIDAVENLGADSGFNHYLLVQYDTKPPAQQQSGSLQAKKEEPESKPTPPAKADPVDLTKPTPAKPAKAAK